MKNGHKLTWLLTLTLVTFSPTASVVAQDAEKRVSLEQQLLALEMKSQQTRLELGPSHPNARMLQQQIESVKAMINMLELGATAKKKDEMRETLTQLVKQVFELQTQLHAERVQRAADDLEKAKEALAARKKSAPQLIERQVEELLAGLSDEGSAKKPTIYGASGGYSSAATKYEGSGLSLATQGWEVWRARKYKDAAKWFEASLKKDAKNPNALNGLGWSYLHSGRHSEAVGAFEKALALEPEHPGAMNGVGQALMAQGKYDEAKNRFLFAVEDLIEKLGEEKAIRRKATAAWLGLVRVLINSGDLDGAQKWIERYRKHDPKQPIINGMYEEIKAARKGGEAEL
ncbi:MAG: tetratricopeptide repeat protein [Planctomycetota bacterium]